MEEELDLKEIIKGLWNKKIFIIVITIIFMIVGIVKYKTEVKVDDKSLEENSDRSIADATFVLGTRTNGENETEYFVVDDNITATLNEISKSNNVLTDVINELGLDKKDINKLRDAISLSRNINSSLLEISVKLKDSDTAINVANILLNKISDKVKEIYGIEKIMVIDAPNIIEKDDKVVKPVVTEENISESSGKMSFEGKTKIVFYTVIGFVLSCGIVVVIEIFNTSVKNAKELEACTKLKTLMTIDKKDKNNKEKFKQLRVNISECKTVLITSPTQKEGKTYVATNLAESFSKLGKKVVLLDLVQNENSLITKHNGKGLSDYLQSNDKFVEKYVADTSIKNLGILTAGKDNINMTELLEGPKMIESLQTLERLYDIIIIDSEGALNSANTLAVAKIAKYSILVSNERKTKIENIVKAKNNIDDIGGNVIGNILNRI